MQMDLVNVVVPPLIHVAHVDLLLNDVRDVVNVTAIVIVIIASVMDAFVLMPCVLVGIVILAMAVSVSLAGHASHVIVTDAVAVIATVITVTVTDATVEI